MEILAFIINRWNLQTQPLVSTEASPERITHCGIFALSIWRLFNEIFASIMMTLASTLGWFSRVVTVTIELDGPMVADEGEGNHTLHIIIWYLVFFEAVQHHRFRTYFLIVCSELKLIIHNDMFRQLCTPLNFHCRYPSQVLTQIDFLSSHLDHCKLITFSRTKSFDCSQLGAEFVLWLRDSWNLHSHDFHKILQYKRAHILQCRYKPAYMKTFAYLKLFVLRVYHSMGFVYRASSFIRYKRYSFSYSQQDVSLYCCHL